jgi:hypothetical protein
MRSTQDQASEAARALAQARRSPEARLRAAVATVAEHAADLDEVQRGTLLEAVTEEARNE